MKKYLLKTDIGEQILIKDKEIFNLYDILVKRNLKYQYKNLNNNIKNLKISSIRFLEKKIKNRDVLAYYNCKKNKIKYTKSKKEKSLPHEFMHMASTIKNPDGSIFSGFSQSTKIGNFTLIGKRLNEGYTQLLSERYFPNSEKKAYPLEKVIAFQLENIIGKNKMEQMYFDAQLSELIKELLNYKEEKDILTFIFSIDFIENVYNKLDLLKNLKLIRETYLYIMEFLISIKLEKLKEDNLNNDNMKKNLKNYIENFVFKINIKKENIDFEIINIDLINEIYQKYCNKVDKDYKIKTYLK